MDANRLVLPPSLKPSKSRKSVSGGDKGDKDDKRHDPQPEVDIIIYAQPDGRRCDTCPNKDSDEDPTIKKMKEANPGFDPIAETGPWMKSLRRTRDGKLLCWWGGSQTSQGLTQKPGCGYCSSAYNNQIRTKQITIAKWKQDLGANMQKLQAHQTSVVVMSDEIAARGGNFKIRLNWDNIEAKVLTLMKSFIARKKAPGADWYPQWYYDQVEDTFKSLEGHYAFDNDGKPGMMVPNAPVVKFRGEELMAAQISQKHKASDELDPSSLHQLAADFVNSGFSGALPSTSFAAGSLQDSFNEEGGNAPAATPTPGPSRGQAPPPTPKAVQASPKAAQVSPHIGRGILANGNLVLPGEQPKQEQEKGLAQVKVEPGTAVVPASKASAGRGRRPKAWANLVDIEMNNFAIATESSVMWNGSEISTATKNLSSIEKDTQMHTRMSHVYMYMYIFFTIPATLRLLPLAIINKA